MNLFLDMADTLFDKPAQVVVAQAIEGEAPVLSASDNTLVTKAHELVACGADR